MANKINTAASARRLWSHTVTPLMTAAREGATHAAVTARQERTRMQRLDRPWWRSRGALIAAAGIVALGTAGTVATLAARRRLAELAAEQGEQEQAQTGAPAPAGPGRVMVTRLTRTIRHRVWGADEPPAVTETATSPLAAAHG